MKLMNDMSNFEFEGPSPQVQKNFNPDIYNSRSYEKSHDSNSQFNGSYSSLERPETEMGHEKYNGIVLAPLRENFGAGPGTANTQGAPKRKVK
jgi:hypothetical protein